MMPGFENPCNYSELDTVTPGSICATCHRFCRELGRALHDYLNGPGAVDPCGWSEGADIAQTRYISLGRFLYHANLAALREGFVRSCHLCTLHWISIDPNNLFKNSENTALEVDVSLQDLPYSKEVFSYAYSNAYLSLVSENAKLSSDKIDLNFTFRKECNTSSPLGNNINFDMSGFEDALNQEDSWQERPVFTGSKLSLDLAKSWLEECNKSHPSCQRGSTTTMPTRLVDISSGNKTLFIHRPSGVQKSSRVDYVALSHCWGNAKFLKLKKTNFLELRDQFSMDELPRTWIEAISVARMLGFGYIWIDALCIIQDSSYDWSLESPLMGSVYGNCSLNLAALGAEASDEGLFSFRNPLMFTDCDVTAPIRRGMRSGQFSLVKANFAVSKSIGNTWQGTHLPGPISYYNAMTEQPLNKRGWVLQERALSPRTLYFGTAGIFWDCRESEADETTAPEAKSWCQGQHDVTNIKKSLHRLLVNPRLHRSHQLGPKIAGAWYDLVGLYCPSKLTYEADRLGAVSGVAKIIRDQTKSEYYAGLWGLTLLDDMLWAVPRPVPLRDGISATKPGHLSFSWASLGAPSSISWPSRFAKHNTSLSYEAHVLSALCKGSYPGERASSDKHHDRDDTDVILSKVATGEIRISCKVRRFQKAAATYPDGFGFHYSQDKTYPEEITTHLATLRETRTRDDRCLDFGLGLYRAEKGYKRVGMFCEAYELDQARKWESEYKLHAQKEHASDDPLGRTTILLT